MRDEDESRVTIRGEILEERMNSLLLKVGEQEVWLPKSQISRILRIPGEPVEMDITEWIAVKKGLTP